MKTVLFTMWAAVALVVPVAAQQTASGSSTQPDWRYCWHEGRWWYWMPENRWVIWSGTAWAPYKQLSNRSDKPNVEASQTSLDSKSHDTRDLQGGTAAPQSTWGPRRNRQSSYYPAHSGQGGSGYAGYGWTWGPGTAFRDAPGTGRGF